MAPKIPDLLQKRAGYDTIESSRVESQSGPILIRSVVSTLWVVGIEPDPWPASSGNEQGVKARGLLSNSESSSGQQIRYE